MEGSQHREGREKWPWTLWVEATDGEELFTVVISNPQLLSLSYYEASHVNEGILAFLAQSEKSLNQALSYTSDRNVTLCNHITRHPRSDLVWAMSHLKAAMLLSLLLKLQKLAKGHPCR